MNQINFSTYQFRPSGLAKLMTNSRSKDGSLSETTKSYLQELYIKEVFGREKLITSPAMRKGTSVESDSLDLVQAVFGKTYFKNEKKLANDFITGTPDVIDTKNNLVIDIKSSWDIWTFAKVTEKSAIADYGWQLLGYMWLTGVTKASLIYALVNTPEFIINDELYRLSFKLPPDTDTDPYKINFLFDDIESKLKVKRFDLEYSEEKIEELKAKIQLCRAYLSTLSL